MDLLGVYHIGEHAANLAMSAGPYINMILAIHEVANPEFRPHCSPYQASEGNEGHGRKKATSEAEANCSPGKRTGGDKDDDDKLDEDLFVGVS